MDPLMKKIYIGAGAVVLFLICTIYACMSCRGESKDMVTYRCQKEGCRGERQIEHKKGKPVTNPPI